MRKFLYIVLFFLIYYLPVFSCSHDKIVETGKTFFSVKPIFRPTSPEMASIKRDRQNVDEEKKLSFDIFLYGGASFERKDLGRYFLPFGKRELTVGELGSSVVKNETADVIANYFNILTFNKPKAGEPVGNSLNNYTFESVISFKPKQIFYGITLAFKQHISRYIDRGFWYEIVVPFEHVKNEMCLTEKVVRKGGPNGDDPQVPIGYVANMKQAFAQDSWIYGKIKGPQSKTGIADPYLKLGYLYLNNDTHYLDSFFGISLPTGNVPDGEFVFQPIVGNGGHATFILGTSAGFRVWSKCERSIYYELDTCATVYFDNEQTRSFDLKDKQWSRYMWVYLDKKSTSTSPGINSFTKRVNVSHGSSRDLNSAFIYRHKSLQAEVGYHFFGRQAEEIKLVSDWKKGPAIATIINGSNDFIAGGLSRDISTINEYLRIQNDSVNGKEVFKEITASDLNLESAAHPTVIVHTLYGTFSYHWDNCRYPLYIGGGGSYEFSSTNVALERWMAWLRFGIYF